MTARTVRGRRLAQLRTWLAGFTMAIAVPSACGPLYQGDVAHLFNVSNESDADVIVRFGWGSNFVAPAGGAGRAAQGIGPLSGAIEILDLACNVLQELPITTQAGVVTIDEAGAATLTASDASFTDTLERTQRCLPE